MKTRLFTLALGMLGWMAAHGQVTGTFTDTDGTAWANGLYNASFVPTPAAPNISGQSVFAGSLDGTGSLSVALQAANSSWLIQVCSNTSASAPCVQKTVIIGTSNQSITSKFTPLAPPRITAGAGAYAYNDTEVASPSIPGTSYWNTTTPEPRCWTGSAWTGCGSSSGGAVSSVFGRTGAVVAANNDYNFTNLAGNLGLGQGPSGLNGLMLDSAGTISTAVGTDLNTVIATLTGCSTSGFVYTPAGTDCVAQTGFANPMTTSGDVIYGGASGAATREAGPTVGSVPYNWTSTPSGGVAQPPAWGLPGIPGRTVTGTTDTIALTDRSNTIVYNSASAVAVTLTSAATLANSFSFAVWNENTGAVTFTPGAGTINGAGTLVVSEGQNCTISSPDNTNYIARCSSGQLVAGTGITLTASPTGQTVAATGTQTIASGTSAMGTGAITSGTCATVVTTTATGTATTDVIIGTPNADPTGVTGYAVSATGGLYIVGYPTTNNVNWKVCNNTAGSLTPAALTMNWRVVR